MMTTQEYLDLITGEHCRCAQVGRATSTTWEALWPSGEMIAIMQVAAGLLVSVGDRLRMDSPGGSQMVGTVTLYEGEELRVAVDWQDGDLDTAWTLTKEMRFVSTVRACVSPFADVQRVLQGLLINFDIPTAVGQQLDIIGQWVGVVRGVPVPLAGYFFTWDDVPGDGWDGGYWKGTYDRDYGVVILGDDQYRQLINAKIRANSWDGSAYGIYMILHQVFPGAYLQVVDNQDMTIGINIPDGELTLIEKALLTEGYVPIKPAGVSIEFVDI